MDVAIAMERQNCCVCGIAFYIPAHMVADRRRTTKDFFCPNGHNLCFPPAEDSVQSLKEKLAKANGEVERLKKENLELRHQLEQLEAKLTEDSKGL